MENDNTSTPMASLLQLSHELGRDDRTLAILAEGNTSTRLGENRFLVKASGSNLGTLSEADVVTCKSRVLLSLLDREEASDAEVGQALMSARTGASMKRPSVEALFHAWLLTLPGIQFVGHVHPESANAILCSPRAREFATKRLFPDEIVCCDVESVLVAYTDPGLKLAQAIRTGVGKFMTKHDRPPRVILLQNHGVITLGRSAEAVLSAMLMVEKAARIWLGAAAVGGPTFMTSKAVARISGRPDEALRQKVLKL